MCKNEKTHLIFLFFNIYLTHGNVGEFFKKVVSVLYYSDFIKGNRVRFIAIILLIIGGSALLAGNNALLTLLGDSLRKGNLLLFVSIIGINVVVDSIGSSLSYRANYLYDKQTQEYFHKLRFAEVEKIILQASAPNLSMEERNRLLEYHLGKIPEVSSSEEQIENYIFQVQHMTYEKNKANEMLEDILKQRNIAYDLDILLAKAREKPLRNPAAQLKGGKHI